VRQLGIVAALRDEARLLTRQPLELRQPTALGENVVLQVSGMGPERAKAAGEDLISRGAQALLSWGTAAALDPTLMPGTLMLSNTVFSAEGGAFEVDKEWQESVSRSLSSSLNVHHGAVCESGVILDSPAAKAGLYAQNGCTAVDMESAALAQLASEKGLPFLSLRYIVDPHDMALPVSLMASLDTEGQVRLMRLLGQLVLHPTDIVALVRLGRAFGQAKKSMQTTIETLGVQMGLPHTERSSSV
jgi:adenosylhomocysteine nucleosidase